MREKRTVLFDDEEFASEYANFGEAQCLAPLEAELARIKMDAVLATCKYKNVQVANYMDCFLKEVTLHRETRDKIENLNKIIKIQAEALERIIDKDNVHVTVYSFAFAYNLVKHIAEEAMNLVKQVREADELK